MSRPSTGLSKSERSLRPLLVSRRDARVLLGGISTSTLIRLERKGLLIPKRLTRSPSGTVYYAYDNLLQLIGTIRHE